jgi:hypothetical protein
VTGFEVDPRALSATPPTVRVTAIDVGGPAARVGLILGDVIASIDGIDMRANADLFHDIVWVAPDSILVFVVERGLSIPVRAR